MRKYFLGILIIFIGFSAYADEVARTIAKVNKEIITSKDFEEYLKVISYQLSERGTNLPSDEDNLKKEALMKLIEDKLILEEAKKEKIEIPFSLIEDKFNQIVSSYSSRQDFEDSLVEKGLNITLLKEKIKEQYLSRQVIDKCVKYEVSVSPQEISKYYAEHLQDFFIPLTYVLWIAKSPDEEFIKSIARGIEKKGITEAAKEYENILVRMESKEGELIDKISDVLKEIRRGDYLIRQIEGLSYFIYLEKIAPAQAAPLETVKEKIYSALWDKKFADSFAVWINGLKEKAVIKIYQDR